MDVDYEITNFTPYNSPMIEKKISEVVKNQRSGHRSGKIYPELNNYFREEIKEDNLIETLNSELYQSKNNMEEAYLNEFNTLIKKLDDELLHYKKIKNKHLAGRKDNEDIVTKGISPVRDGYS